MTSHRGLNAKIHEIFTFLVGHGNKIFWSHSGFNYSHDIYNAKWGHFWVPNPKFLDCYYFHEKEIGLSCCILLWIFHLLLCLAHACYDLTVCLSPFSKCLSPSLCLFWVCLPRSGLPSSHKSLSSIYITNHPTDQSGSLPHLNPATGKSQCFTPVIVRSSIDPHVT